MIVSNTSSNYSFGNESNLANVTTGVENVVYGKGFDGLTTGSANVAFGVNAGVFVSTGSNNTFLGKEAGYALTTGSGNVFIGHQAGFTEYGSNKLFIENSSSNNPLIYGEFDNDIVGINGKLGVGTTTPSAKLNVADNVSNYIASFENAHNGSYAHGILVKAGQDVHSTYNAYLGFTRPDGTLIGAVFQNTSSSVSYNTTSDKRLKTDITETKYGLEDLMQIEVKDYVYRSDANKQRTSGFLAQDLYEIYPDTVAVEGDDPKTNPWGVDYGKLTPLLVKTVQDLTKLVEEQQKEIEALKAQR